MPPFQSTPTPPIEIGAGGLSRITLAAPDGARAEVYLQGAHTTSWQPALGPERLFLSAAAEFRAGASLRGGIPVVFPQFSSLGSLPKHGFARTATWDFTGIEIRAGLATAHFCLCDSEATRRLWPHAFLAEFSVTVGGPGLEVALGVTNTGAQPMSFTAALHTYLRVADVRAVMLGNLAEVRYLDQVLGDEHVQTEPDLRFSGEVDRVYFNAPARLLMREPERTTRVEKEGFADWVIWNPWAERGAALADLEPDGYRRMVCVEAAAVGAPIRIEAGAEWRALQRVWAE
jgi:glucose-6-phosphate 1-epimerase